MVPNSAFRHIVLHKLGHRLTGNALIRRGASCLLNVGESSWGEFSLGRVVLGRVVFGASCPVSHKICFIV